MGTDPRAPPYPGAPVSNDPRTDLAGVLHDVSNALTVVLGWVAEARAEGAPPEAMAYSLGIIEQRARAARQLARRAIGASIEPSPRDGQFEEALTEVVDALGVEAQRAGVRLMRRGSAHGVRVSGTEDLAHVLTNLLLNALAYAPPSSEVALEVSVDEPHVRIDVSDEGQGIAPEVRATLFDGGKSTREGGAGIGLRHARALARAAGGDLELVPSPRGARFRVTWPRAAALPPPPLSVPPTRPLEGRHVLVVEDDADVTLLLEAALSARGASVSVARTAAELARTVTAAHDTVLLDLSPVARDFEGALAVLRAASPDIRIVVMTGAADKLPEALTGPGVRVVRKPFEVSEVVAALAR